MTPFFTYTFGGLNLWGFYITLYKVTFNFRKGAAAFLKSGVVGTGKPSEMTQDGVVENKETGAHWRVRYVFGRS